MATAGGSGKQCEIKDLGDGPPGAAGHRPAEAGRAADIEPPADPPEEGGELGTREAGPPVRSVRALSL